MAVQTTDQEDKKPASKTQADEVYERYGKGETLAAIARDLKLDDAEVFAIVQAKEKG